MDYPSLKLCIDTSVDDPIKDLYTPCFCWADRFDRGVGYFTSGWISENIIGLGDFVSRGGKIRLITSPIISEQDSDAIINAELGDHSAYEKFSTALNNNVDSLKKEMKEDIFNAFSWMLHDRIIDIKFAIPTNKLENGIFHTKFGIFYNGNDAVSFSGSINDSIHGFQNFEDISVFSTWMGTGAYVESAIKRFERIWNSKDANLKIYNVPEAIKEKIFSLRTSNRPYHLAKTKSNKWEQQDKAIEVFLKKKNGILAMATGTGKTRTAIKIINKLIDMHEIKRIIITMYGNDLLDQWAIQMREEFPNLSIYYHYGSKKEMKDFAMHPDNSMLLVSRDANNLSRILDRLDTMPGNYRDDTLLLFDEVHGAGSHSLIENLSGKISPYKYRLGLSATPEREYDDGGNQFILDEIGEIIFEFSLKDAIEKGILCPFDYTPLPYSLTREERKKKKKIIAAFNAKKESGEPYNENDMFTQLSLVNKTAINKLDEFEILIKSNPNLLKKCIIFVQTMEYGILLQERLINYCDSYHTYYAGDEKRNLEAFANGEFDCLLTCKKVSEGIDISTVTNIVLFSSDRSKLVTTQRIGRALRLDKTNPDKIAHVVDFVISEIDEEGKESGADYERKVWLSELSKVRKKDN